MSRKKRDKSRQAKSKRVLVPNVQRLHSSKASKQPNQLVTISSSESTSANQTAPATDRKVASANQTSANDSLICNLVKWWRGLPMKVAGIIAAASITSLLGFNSLPQSIPLIGFIHQYLAASLIIAGLLILFTLIAMVIPCSQNENITSIALNSGHQHRQWFIATSLSLAGLVLISGLLIVTLIRPTWCSPPFCPGTTYVASTHADSVHDNNLEVYPSALESSTFVLEGEPTQYTAHDLPQQDIAAVDLGSKGSFSRIVLGVHSLLKATYHIIIEQILLVVKQKASVPHPLSVWQANSNLIYQGYPFLVTYKGQKAGGVLLSASASVPPISIDLAPDEDNPLILEIRSTVKVDLRFSIQVIYRVTNDSQWYALPLAKPYEVIFSDAANWHPYELQNAIFIPKAS